MSSGQKDFDHSTPDIPASSATFTAGAITRINAPASLVFRTLRNTETWKDWNRWVPQVTITYQPPEEDEATLAEVAELVRNTSIAGSYDSEIINMNGQNVSRPKTPDGPSIETAPPVLRQRLASNASRASSTSGAGSETAPRNSSQSQTNGERHLSAAQKYAAATAVRRTSVTSSKSDTPQPATTAAAPSENNNSSAFATNSVLVEAPNSSLLVPAPATAASKEAAAAIGPTAKKRNGSLSAPAKRKLSINALYGEPSVRIQLGTKMTFHVRMKLPSSYETRETDFIVTELSRPDDEVNADGTKAVLTQMTRSKTHTLSRTGVYRIVWELSQSYSPPKSFPKFLLQAQRVHEIRPIVRGDGAEVECELRSWEAQRGVLAREVRRKYKDYIQRRFEEWGAGLGAFCESMGGAVERRDFSVG